MINESIKKLLRVLKLNFLINDIYEIKNKYFNSKQNKDFIKKYKKILGKNNKLIFDIGANVGDYTDMYLKLGTKKIISVEPQLKVFKQINNRFMDNKKVICLKNGVGSKIGKLKMYISDEANKLSTFSQEQKDNSRFSKDFVWNKTEFVDIITLNDLIEQYGIPDFIKIDVEGFEYEVLKGLKTPVKLIQFEFILENLELIKNSIEYLSKIDNYKFNIAGTSISNGMVFKEYIDVKNLMYFLKYINIKNFGGDIYAKIEKKG